MITLLRDGKGFFCMSVVVQFTGIAALQNRDAWVAADIIAEVLEHCLLFKHTFYCLVYKYTHFAGYRLYIGRKETVETNSCRD